MLPPLVTLHRVKFLLERYCANIYAILSNIPNLEPEPSGLQKPTRSQVSKLPVSTTGSGKKYLIPSHAGGFENVGLERLAPTLLKLVGSSKTCHGMHRSGPKVADREGLALYKHRQKSKLMERGAKEGGHFDAFNVISPLPRPESSTSAQIPKTQPVIPHCAGSQHAIFVEAALPTSCLAQERSQPHGRIQPATWMCHQHFFRLRD